MSGLVARTGTPGKGMRAVIRWIGPKLPSFVAGAVLTAFVLGLFPQLGTATIDFGALGRSWKTHLAALAVTALALAVIIGPINRFQTLGQAGRKDRIRGFYSPPIIARYFKRFWAGRDSCAVAIRNWEAAGSGAQAAAAESELRDKFEDLMDEFLGSTRITAAKWLLGIAAAVVLFFGVSGGMMWAIETQGVSIRIGETVHYLLALKPGLAVIAAIFGAYTWVASDVIYRYHQSDISSSDIRWYTLRFVVAVPLGLAIAQFSGFRTDNQPEVGNAGPILAFVISMFSMSRIQEILGGFVNRAFVIPGAPPGAKDDVVMALPGIDQRVADRLANEGVTTISMIAAADPVRLSVRAGLPFDLVLEFIDRAILWQYVGAKSLILREGAWSGASHLIEYAEAISPNRQADIDEVCRLRSERQVHAGDLAPAESAAAGAEAVVARATQATPATNAQKTDAARLRSEAEALKARLSSLNQRITEVVANLTAPRPADTLVASMAGKAGLDKDVLAHLIDQIQTNAHARFIADVMAVGATSNAKRS